MRNDTGKIPNERFFMPPSWQWGTFYNAAKRELRFGYAFPSLGEPRAAIIILHGLSEFSEKYFEIINDLLSRNYAVFTMDWQGQGKSHRHLPNPHRRYSEGFEHDVDDLEQFIEYQIYKDMPKDTPLIMLAHSMGANIGMHYLARGKNKFTAAAFSAPLVDIHALKILPSTVALYLTRFFKVLAGKRYVFGGTDWHKNIRTPEDKARLTSDPARRDIQDYWCLHDPALQVGHITFSWLYQAQISCVQLKKIGNKIITPCLFGLAGQDHLVNTDAARVFTNKLNSVKILELPEARHEIMMERDEIRDQFFDTFYEFIEEQLTRKPAKSK